MLDIYYKIALLSKVIFSINDILELTTIFKIQNNERRDNKQEMTTRYIL